MIKNFIPRLAERGRIKIGEKGEMKTSSQGKQFAQPKKLDHMLITTMQRDAVGRLMPDTPLMVRLNPGGGKITEIPVRLLYDDIDLNFQTRYACYRGTRCWCTGDGEVAQRLTGENGKYQEVQCPCERQDPLYHGQDKCKTLGTLQVLIEGVDRIGGVWKFRTTSWNTVNAILSSLALIKTITGGPLAGIPLWMVLSPKTVTVPTSGQNMVVFIISLEYRGPENELAELGYELARRRVEHRVRMETVEELAQKQLVAPHQEPPLEQAETAQEFFPEGAVEDPNVQAGRIIDTPETDTALPLATGETNPETPSPSPNPPQEAGTASGGAKIADPQAGENVPPGYDWPDRGEGLQATEIPSESNGVMRVQIGPEEPDPPQSPPKGKKTHLKPVQADGEGKLSLF
jgi:hypothetical protein